MRKLLLFVLPGIVTAVVFVIALAWFPAISLLKFIKSEADYSLLRAIATWSDSELDSTGSIPSDVEATGNLVPHIAESWRDSFFKKAFPASPTPHVATVFRAVFSSEWKHEEAEHIKRAAYVLFPQPDMSWSEPGDILVTGESVCLVRTSGKHLVDISGCRVLKNDGSIEFIPSGLTFEELRKFLNDTSH